MGDTIGNIQVASNVNLYVEIDFCIFCNGREVFKIELCPAVCIRRYRQYVAVKVIRSRRCTTANRRTKPAGYVRRNYRAIRRVVFIHAVITVNQFQKSFYLRIVFHFQLLCRRKLLILFFCVTDSADLTDCVRHRYGIRKIFNQFIDPINRSRHNNRRFIRKTFTRRCIVFNDYVIIFKVNFCLVDNLYKRVIFVRIFYYNRKFIRAVPTNLIAYFQIAKLLNCFRIAVQECHINEIVHIEFSFVIIFRVTDFTAILNVSNSYEIKLKII